MFARTAVVLLVGIVVAAADFNLSIVHFNDFHARFEEQSNSSGVCHPEKGACHGGFSRLYAATMELMSKRHNPILLNAGDNFQGTLWYNLFKWNATQFFLNLLPTTAHTLGNHEFDDDIEGVVPFLKSMKAPTIVCNMNDSLVPEIQGLYNKSIIVDIEGKKVGIVGVLVSTVNEISSTGNLSFFDEVESVNKEATRLVEEEGVFTVIVLSHCGYDTEQKIARKAVKHIGVVVGAHSHTLLYTGTPPDGKTALGPYPTVVKRDIDGKDVLVVQASAYTRYLGDLVVSFDDDGEVSSWEGAPIFLSPSMPQDVNVNELLKPYQEIVAQAGNKYLGQTDVFLSNACYSSECNLGNFICDALVGSYVSEAEPGCWTYAALSVMNNGGIRGPIPIGNITYNDLATVQPFESTLDVGELQGKHIKEMLELAAYPYLKRDSITELHLLQVSGMQVVYDLSEIPGERVRSLKLRSPCNASLYEDAEPEKYYRMVITSFLGNGGDGFTVIPDNVKNYRVGKLDIDEIANYITNQSPINIGNEGRITFIGNAAEGMAKLKGRKLERVSRLRRAAHERL